MDGKFLVQQIYSNDWHFSPNLLRECKAVPWDRHKRQAAEHERKVHDLLHKAG